MEEKEERILRLFNTKPMEFRLSDLFFVFDGFDDINELCEFLFLFAY